MADNARQPNLNLTPAEKRVFYQLFQAADTTNLGVITGEIAVPFFEKTKLAPETLGLIWQIADKENRGLLTPSGFGVVLRLIGHAQAGRAPTDELALQSGPLPKFDGIVVDTSVPSPRESAGSPQPAAGGPPIRVPPLNPEDVNKFVSLFEKSDVARSGTITGETAKQIFERARLPNEVLGRIWNLADTKQRGVLDTTEFIIAMHLLTSFKSGAMRGIPQVLPPGLYDAAARRGASRPSFSGPKPGLDVPPVPAIPKQFTGPQRTQSPINRQQFGSPLSAQSTGGEWLVSPAEKLQFDNYFNTVDTAKSGVISGDQAVSFFTKAQLPEETLAQIWDLADIDADGQLTRDEFAVAMYLIRLQYTGKGPIPQHLPPALIPPSMRRPGSAQAVPVPAPAPAPPAPIQTAADDLFGLDPFATAPAAPIPAPAPAQMPQSTGNSNSPFAAPGSPGPQSSPPGSATTFKPFVPTSTFGQSLQPQATGASSGPSTARLPPQPSDDLLGDNDPEESSKLTQETTELANLSNQIGSLANEMQNVQTKRSGTEQELSQSSQQKRDFESRLAQARSMYEQEVKNFKALEEKLKTSKAETTKLQQEYALIDGSRQDLQNQYNQVSAALAADQQENASLKEKIREANAAVAQLKPALEKARSEARQQKGLAAINKKQLATVEGERDKIQEEIDDSPKDNTSRDTPAESEEVASPPSNPPAVTSPAASTTSQNTNPFFKRTMTGSSENNVASPQISNDQQRAFDSLFGPSFGATPATAVTPPPPTSFRADSQANSVASPVGSGVPTPSVSPPPSSAGAFGSEPPPPALSRQMTPNALPLTGTLSETTSTKVSPPGSRFGPQDASSVGTPSRAGGSEARPASTSPFDETEDSKERFPPIPGAFEEPSPSEEKPAEGKDPSFDELFGGPAHQRSKSQKDNDFEEAFAALKGPNASEATKPNGAPESEFPPIREIDDDDDDDSTDSETQLGFDDNFTPVFPQSHATSKSDKIEASQLAAFPTPGSSNSPTLAPPAAESQPSPPKYDEDAEKQAPGNMPPEFGGLLPTRSDPTAAPDAPHSVETTTGAPIVGGEAQQDTTKAPPPTQAPGGSKAPDFEAAFSGLNLAPAKEADDDDEDDDFSRTEGRQHNMDFDFSFDSAASQQQRTATQTSASGNTSSDFFSFDQSAHAPSSSGPANPGTKSGDHDWEALFAPLDNIKSPGAETINGAPSGASTESKQPGWALQNETQDDPNLQRLTGMGFPREASLVALEKFDYNIDMAIDHLTKA
ncbi:hypothetical protein ASPVEDRAFT_35723 [Aspergillus versicolor CBS 583.65]|uniref:Actin cytoskeleton-regulatory complex protein END3 n=1 Tax=Aspergillus versicolor CBS 583.65 TaxID=1036611 RepID=A0A1L9P487_ASPVE|nr:uncharacterized protein ASPVEDRAFT_35723 [Aspergillus versicolor CBS 583.65]OJI96340.1 hypothetical protein ASPVEDRAFT_35723 [Aspergillus versicolor CBS 583.65]